VGIVVTHGGGSRVAGRVPNLKGILAPDFEDSLDSFGSNQPFGEWGEIKREMHRYYYKTNFVASGSPVESDGGEKVYFIAVDHISNEGGECTREPVESSFRS